MTIAGSNLNDRQRAEVLNAFGYRWTFENEDRARRWYGPASIPTAPLVSDEQWLRTHAFHFVKDGSRLMFNRRFAEPVL